MCSALHAASAMVVAVRIVNTVVVSLCICRCPLFLIGGLGLGFRFVCWSVVSFGTSFRVPLGSDRHSRDLCGALLWRPIWN